MNSLKYLDTTDRAYGLCGMVMALFIYDADGYIASLSIDAPSDEGLRLTPDFFVVNNPQLSAKAIWHSDYRRFQLTSAMFIGNLLCRSLTRRKSDLSNEVSNLLLSHLLQEGEEACGLEPSEVKQLLAEPFSYLRRFFMHPQITTVIQSMVEELSRTHTLDRDRIIHFLLPLNRL